MYATQRILAFPHAPLDLVRSSFPLKYRRQQVHLAKKKLNQSKYSLLYDSFGFELLIERKNLKQGCFVMEKKLSSVWDRIWQPESKVLIVKKATSYV